ncbi:MAG: M1 family metallopeptidase [Saprospiraceae bacterium]|nr:M1 family metallopeptidase [Saprospiraceae bacterium]
MKNFFLLVTFSFYIQFINAQKPYFQQEANYKINATLDDKKHLLNADVELTYKNNSSDPLPILYLLLPANAYSSQRSAYAKQELAKGKTRFYFADTKEMGNFSNLNIQINNKRVEVEIDRNNPDVAKVKLERPILAGDSIKITTPFVYKIPSIFSRGGHIGQQYLMTQWYPRVAVYDRDGWHPQPYLDQGEFYAEFGHFDVTLTLPDNYVVGATGNLETASERDFLAKKAADTEGVLSKVLDDKFPINKIDTFPKSSERLKTIRYTADNVIDFAWFADKRFMVTKGDTALKSGRNVETYTYFAPKFAKIWQKSNFYVKRAIGFYSEHVGEYPHPHASAVMADEGFGGGMEYPMITVLSGGFDAKGVDGTIAHEVGHNWFQGILASNERDHAWLDEGLNSYYDHLYSTEYYGQESFEDYGIPRFIAKGTDIKPMSLFTQSLFFQHKDQAPETTSNDLIPANYMLGAYEKPAMSLAILAKQVGQDKFEELMQQYFTVWKFKHPQPTDFKKIWTDDSLNIGAVSWFFDGMINSTGKVDYKITHLDQNDTHWKATVKNIGAVATPFTVSGVVSGDSAVFTVRLAGLATGEQTVVFIPKKEGISMITIDFRQLTPDVNRANNNIKTRGLLPKLEPLRVKFLAGLDNSKRTNIYATPLLAANVYDQLMLGAWIHNGALPLKSFEWSVAPMYSIGTKSLAGVGNVNYAFFAGKNKINVGVNARRFAFDYNTLYKTTRIYDRVTPSVSIEFGENPMRNFSSKLQLRHLLIGEQAFTYDKNNKYEGKERNTSGITELTYSGAIKNALGNTSFKTALEQQNYVDIADKKQSYLRLTAEVKKDFMYQYKKRVYLRLFMGGFLNNTRRNGANVYGDNRGSIGLVNNGGFDYRYDGLWLGRNERQGAASQQIDPNTEGGMKYVLASGSATQLGASNDFVAALNFKMDLPVKLPQFLQLKPYFDMGYFTDKRAVASDQKLLMSGGIAWEIFGDAAAIYFPVYFNGASDDPNSLHAYAVTQRGKYINRVTFSLNLKKMNPLGLMKGVLNF